MGPAFQVITNDEAPVALGAGQTLQLQDSGQLAPGFIAGPGSHVKMLAGNLGANFTALGADVEIRSGTVGAGFTALEGPIVETFGGTFSSPFSLLAGAHGLIHGGTFSQTGFYFQNGAVIDVFGTSFLHDGQSLAGAIDG